MKTPSPITLTITTSEAPPSATTTTASNHLSYQFEHQEGKGFHLLDAEGVKVATPSTDSNENLSWEAGDITGAKLLALPELNSVLAKLPSPPIAFKLDDANFYDLMTPITTSGTLKFLTMDDAEALPIYRHTTAHVMAYAIWKLFPKVHLAIGPPIDNGFYYDFDNISLKEEDFKPIEAEMRAIIKKGYKNERFVISRTEALKLFKDEPYKLRIIEDLGTEQTLTYYKMGEFIDLCRGPHLPSVRPLKGFKLDRLTGAYWRGNAKNKMLTRLYALSFRNQETLKAYIHEIKERERYDHNKIGREMGLFINDEQVGQGLPLLTHKGTTLKQVLQELVEAEERKNGYLHTLTPFLAKSDLYKTSGHWDHYKDDMFVIKDGDNELALRPMTCPFHFALYNSQPRSYKDLPIRYAETSTLFRNESSGEMHGLIRVRQFTLSDGHVICREDQVEEEFKRCLDLLVHFLKILDFKDYSFRLSKWDPKKAGTKFIDNPVLWEQTENQMREILTKHNLQFVEAVGEAAFYGPKLDIQTKNVYGKEDTLLTVQIDFALPERFKMTYTDSNDKKQQPIVIHRASIGCYERTIALLIERYHGNLPFWLAPEQLAILPVHPNLNKAAEELETRFIEERFRSKCDLREESLGKKIRAAQKEHIPYLIILGEKEHQTQTLSVRTRENQILNDIPLETFIANCRKMQRERLVSCLITPLAQKK